MMAKRVSAKAAQHQITHPCFIINWIRPPSSSCTQTNTHITTERRSRSLSWA